MSFIWHKISGIFLTDREERIHGGWRPWDFHSASSLHVWFPLPPTLFKNPPLRPSFPIATFLLHSRYHLCCTRTLEELCGIWRNKSLIIPWFLPASSSWWLTTSGSSFASSTTPTKLSSASIPSTAASGSVPWWR